MARLHEQLETKTGEPWEFVYSSPKGCSTYREKMAFLWRSDKFDLVGDALLYPDLNDSFARPPYAALRRPSNFASLRERYWRHELMLVVSPFMEHNAEPGPGTDPSGIFCGTMLAMSSDNVVHDP